jgi:hypothetical protein
MPKIPPQATPAFWGAVAGAIGLAIVGFNFGGWHTAAGTADIASNAADAAVVKALTPVCVEAFQEKATPAQWASFKAKADYDRNDIVTKVVTIPGEHSVDYSLAGACADALTKLPAKSAQKS